MALHELTADEMLAALAKRQDQLLDAESEEARAKGKFEAIQGAVIRHIRDKGQSVEVAKRLMWKEEAVLTAHDEYLEAWGAFQKAKNAEKRAVEAIRLWQTVRADVRRV